MADRKLRTVTTLLNPNTGEHESFEPGTSESELPEWAEGRIDNESAWSSPLTEEEMEELGVDVAPGSYSDLPVATLRELVVDRGIEAKSSNKGDLVAALTAHDEALANTTGT
jgi:hypothetical protein